MTYQLAASLLTAAGGRTVETRITRLTDCVFYAVVIVDGPEGRQEVDARPSDAVTLAAVMNAPIRAEASLFTDPPLGWHPGFDWESLPTEKPSWRPRLRSTCSASASRTASDWRYTGYGSARDGVVASAGCGPDQGAGFGLGEVPAAGLLGLVVAAAQRVEIALAGPAALVVGDGVVVVAAGRGAAAAGESAPGASDLDDVPQRVRGLIPGGLAPVGADPGFDRGDRHRREPGRRGRCRVVRVRRGRTRGRRAARRARGG